jgi:hypothetical protein
LLGPVAGHSVILLRRRESSAAKLTRHHSEICLEPMALLGLSSVVMMLQRRLDMLGVRGLKCQGLFAQPVGL